MACKTIAVTSQNPLMLAAEGKGLTWVCDDIDASYKQSTVPCG